MSGLASRALVGVLWLLHFLPLPLLNPLSQAVGLLFYLLGRERRRVARINLRLCFPELSHLAREKLLLAHFRAFGRSVLERVVAWWGRPERIRRLVRIEGWEHWQAVRGHPVIWFAPHFVGLDLGGVRLALEVDAASMYSAQKNPVFDALLYAGRSRFGRQQLFPRHAGVREVVRVIRAGTPFYYLPDMDFGPRDSIFVPFFGVQAATITGLSRLSRLCGAVVLPVVTEMRAWHYVVRFYPPWDDFPSGDDGADARRMNAFIEARVHERPEQYYWLHKRFKTRLPGEPNPYGKHAR